MSHSDDAAHRGKCGRGSPEPDPLQDEALRWFLDLQAATDKSAVQQALDAWLASDPRHAEAFAKVNDLWNSAEFGKAVLAYERGDPARQHRADIAVPNGLPTVLRSRSARSWDLSISAIAAVLILAIVPAHYSGLFIYLRADYVTPTGQQRRIALPDGSTLLLNSKSAVALDFNPVHRNLRLLEGEAFFSVVRDADRPFRVTAHFAKVEVTGTKFAVRATGDADNVTVQDGSVSVLTPAANGKTIKLQPRDAVAVTATGASMPGAVDLDYAFAWLEGRIRFSDRPLSSVLDELRRYHRGVIIVADRRLGNIRVSGNYRLDDPALIVASLAEAVGAKLTRISDHVLILR